MSAAIVLSACGAGGENQKAQTPPQDAAQQFVNWASINADQIIVPQGVTYTTTDGAAHISGVPLNAGAGGSTGGVGVRLPDAFEQQASGHQVRVTVRASSADEGALLGVAYSTADVGNSGWQAFPLTPAPADYTFTYDVATVHAGNGDYLGFRSYNQGHVQVLGYRVEVLGPSAAAPANPTSP